MTEIIIKSFSEIIFESSQIDHFKEYRLAKSIEDLSVKEKEIVFDILASELFHI